MARRVTRAQQRAGAATRSRPPARPQPPTSRAPAAAPSRELTPLTRADAAWAAGTAVIAAILFSTILTSHPALGDAPESVAGVDSLGVLHAPGYPAYVLAARLFTLLEPFGDITFRVNLFSLVCASLTVAGVFVLARRCGAARWAAGLGGLGLAATAGFWFYSTFAKHNTFSGLVVVIALILLLEWAARPSTRRLTALAAVLGVGLAASWQLVTLLLPTVVFVLVMKRQAFSLRSLVPAVLVGFVVVGAFYGFVMVRAAQDPALNWGEATTLGRVVSLVSRADFEGDRPLHRADEGGGADRAREERQGGGRRAAGGQKASESIDPLAAFVRYAKVFWLELGVAGVLLAAWGLFASLTRWRNPASYALLITFVVNLLGVIVMVGAWKVSYDLILIQQGFLVGVYIPLACWLALGATDVTARVAAIEWVRELDGRAKPILAATGILLAGWVLVPLVVLHSRVVDRAEEPLADRYASSVFSELPHGAAVFVLGAEATQPLIYRQVVHHERRDVQVIAADGLTYGWYREQIEKRLGRRLPRRVGSSAEDAQSAVKSLEGVRPVYLDMRVAQFLGRDLGYRPIGLLAEVGPGRGPAPVRSPLILETRLHEAEAKAGIPGELWTEWPAKHVATSYAAAANEVARAYFERGDTTGMSRAVRHVLSIDPKNQLALRNLAKLHQNPSIAPPASRP